MLRMETESQTVNTRSSLEATLFNSTPDDHQCEILHCDSEVSSTGIHCERKTAASASANNVNQPSGSGSLLNSIIPDISVADYPSNLHRKKFRPGKFTLEEMVNKLHNQQEPLLEKTNGGHDGLSPHYNQCDKAVSNSCADKKFPCNADVLHLVEQSDVRHLRPSLSLNGEKTSRVSSFVEERDFAKSCPKSVTDDSIHLLSTSLPCASYHNAELTCGYSTNSIISSSNHSRFHQSSPEAPECKRISRVTSETSSESKSLVNKNGAPSDIGWSIDVPAENARLKSGWYADCPAHYSEKVTEAEVVCLSSSSSLSCSSVQSASNTPLFSDTPSEESRSSFIKISDAVEAILSSKTSDKPTNFTDALCPVITASDDTSTTKCLPDNFKGSCCTSFELEKNNSGPDIDLVTRSNIYSQDFQFSLKACNNESGAEYDFRRICSDRVSLRQDCKSNCNGTLEDIANVGDIIPSATIEKCSEKICSLAKCSSKRKCSGLSTCVEAVPNAPCFGESREALGPLYLKSSGTCSKSEPNVGSMLSSNCTCSETLTISTQEKPLPLPKSKIQMQVFESKDCDHLSSEVQCDNSLIHNTLAQMCGHDASKCEIPVTGENDSSTDYPADQWRRCNALVSDTVSPKPSKRCSGAAVSSWPLERFSENFYLFPGESSKIKQSEKIHEESLVDEKKSVDLDLISKLPSESGKIYGLVEDPPCISCTPNKSSVKEGKYGLKSLCSKKSDPANINASNEPCDNQNYSDNVKISKTCVMGCQNNQASEEETRRKNEVLPRDDRNNSPVCSTDFLAGCSSSKEGSDCGIISALCHSSNSCKDIIDRSSRLESHSSLKCRNESSENFEISQHLIANPLKLEFNSKIGNGANVNQKTLGTFSFNLDRHHSWKALDDESLVMVKKCMTEMLNGKFISKIVSNSTESWQSKEQSFKIFNNSSMMAGHSLKELKASSKMFKFQPSRNSNFFFNISTPFPSIYYPVGSSVSVQNDKNNLEVEVCNAPWSKYKYFKFDTLPSALFPMSNMRHQQFKIFKFSLPYLRRNQSISARTNSSIEVGVDIEPKSKDLLTKMKFKPSSKHEMHLSSMSKSCVFSKTGPFSSSRASDLFTTIAENKHKLLISDSRLDFHSSKYDSTSDKVYLETNPCSNKSDTRDVQLDHLYSSSSKEQVLANQQGLCYLSQSELGSTPISAANTLGQFKAYASSPTACSSYFSKDHLFHSESRPSSRSQDCSSLQLEYTSLKSEVQTELNASIKIHRGKLVPPKKYAPISQRFLAHSKKLVARSQKLIAHSRKLVSHSRKLMVCSSKLGSPYFSINSTFTFSELESRGLSSRSHMRKFCAHISKFTSGRKLLLSADELQISAIGKICAQKRFNPSKSSSLSLSFENSVRFINSISPASMITNDCCDKSPTCPKSRPLFRSEATCPMPIMSGAYVRKNCEICSPLLMQSFNQKVSVQSPMISKNYVCTLHSPTNSFEFSQSVGGSLRKFLKDILRLASNPELIKKIDASHGRKFNSNDSLSPDALKELFQIICTFKQMNFYSNGFAFPEISGIGCQKNLAVPMPIIRSELNENPLFFVHSSTKCENLDKNVARKALIQTPMLDANSPVFELMDGQANQSVQNSTNGGGSCESIIHSSKYSENFNDSLLRPFSKTGKIVSSLLESNKISDALRGSVTFLSSEKQSSDRKRSRYEVDHIVDSCFSKNVLPLDKQVSMYNFCVNRFCASVVSSSQEENSLISNENGFPMQPRNVSNIDLRVNMPADVSTVSNRIEESPSIFLGISYLLGQAHEDSSSLNECDITSFNYLSEEVKPELLQKFSIQGSQTATCDARGGTGSFSSKQTSSVEVKETSGYEDAASAFSKPASSFLKTNAVGMPNGRSVSELEDTSVESVSFGRNNLKKVQAESEISESNILINDPEDFAIRQQRPREDKGLGSILNSKVNLSPEKKDNTSVKGFKGHSHDKIGILLCAKVEHLRCGALEQPALGTENFFMSGREKISVDETQHLSLDASELSVDKTVSPSISTTKNPSVIDMKNIGFECRSVLADEIQRVSNDETKGPLVKTKNPSIGMATDPFIDEVTNPPIAEATKPWIGDATKPSIGETGNASINETENSRVGKEENFEVECLLVGETENFGVSKILEYSFNGEVASVTVGDEVRGFAVEVKDSPVGEVNGPSVGSEVKGPSVGSEVKGPSVGEVKGPSVGGEVKGPSVGGEVKGPSVGGEVKGPSVGDEVKGPSVGDEVKGPSVGGEVKGPSVGGEVKGPSVGGEVKGPSVGGEVKGPSVGGEVKGPSVGGEVKGPSVGGEVKGPSVGGEVKGPSVGGEVKGPSVGGEVEGPFVGGEVEGPSVGGEVEGPSVGGEVEGPSVGGEVKGPSVGGEVKGPSVGGGTKNLSVRQLTSPLMRLSENGSPRIFHRVLKNSIGKSVDHQVNDDPSESTGKDCSAKEFQHLSGSRLKNISVCCSVEPLAPEQVSRTLVMDDCTSVLVKKASTSVCDEPICNEEKIISNTGQKVESHISTPLERSSKENKPSICTWESVPFAAETVSHNACRENFSEHKASAVSMCPQSVIDSSELSVQKNLQPITMSNVDMDSGRHKLISNARNRYVKFKASACSILASKSHESVASSTSESVIFDSCESVSSNSCESVSSNSCESVSSNSCESEAFSPCGKEAFTSCESGASKSWASVSSESLCEESAFQPCESLVSEQRKAMFYKPCGGSSKPCCSVACEMESVASQANEIVKLSVSCPVRTFMCKPSLINEEAPKVDGRLESTIPISSPSNHVRLQRRPVAQIKFNPECSLNGKLKKAVSISSSTKSVAGKNSNSDNEVEKMNFCNPTFVSLPRKILEESSERLIPKKKSQTIVPRKTLKPSIPGKHPELIISEKSSSSLMIEKFSESIMFEEHSERPACENSSEVLNNSNDPEESDYSISYRERKALPNNRRVECEDEKFGNVMGPEDVYKMLIPSHSLNESNISSFLNDPVEIKPPDYSSNLSRAQMLTASLFEPPQPGTFRTRRTMVYGYKQDKRIVEMTGENHCVQLEEAITSHLKSSFNRGGKCNLCNSNVSSIANHVAEFHICLSYRPLTSTAAFYHHTLERYMDFPDRYSDTMYGNPCYLCKACDFWTKSMDKAWAHAQKHPQVHQVTECSRNKCRCGCSIPVYSYKLNYWQRILKNSLPCHLCGSCFRCDEGLKIHLSTVHKIGSVCNRCSIVLTCPPLQHNNEHLASLESCMPTPPPISLNNISFNIVDNLVNYLDGRCFRVSFHRNDSNRFEVELPLYNVPEDFVVEKKFLNPIGQDLKKHKRNKCTVKVPGNDRLSVNFDVPIQILLQKKCSLFRRGRKIFSISRPTVKEDDLFSVLGLKHNRSSSSARNKYRAPQEIPQCEGRESAVDVIEGKLTSKFDNSPINGKKEEFDAGNSCSIRGEWHKDHTFVCCACGTIEDDLAEIMDHKWAKHAGVLCAHTMIADQDTVPVQFCQQYKPPVQRQVLTELEANCNVVKPLLACTKCMSEFTSIAKLHSHMVECGSLLLMEASKYLKRNKKNSRFLRRRGQGIPRRLSGQSSNTSRIPKEMGSAKSYEPPTSVIKRRLEGAVQSIDNRLLKKRLTDIIRANSCPSRLRSTAVISRRYGRMKLRRKRYLEDHSNRVTRSTEKKSRFAKSGDKFTRIEKENGDRNSEQVAKVHNEEEKLVHSGNSTQRNRRNRRQQNLSRPKILRPSILEDSEENESETDSSARSFAGNEMKKETISNGRNPVAIIPSRHLLKNKMAHNSERLLRGSKKTSACNANQVKSVSTLNPSNIQSKHTLSKWKLTSKGSEARCRTPRDGGSSIRGNKFFSQVKDNSASSLTSRSCSPVVRENRSDLTTNSKAKRPVLLSRKKSYHPRRILSDESDGPDSDCGGLGIRRCKFERGQGTQHSNLDDTVGKRWHGRRVRKISSDELTSDSSDEIEVSSNKRTNVNASKCSFVSCNKQRNAEFPSSENTFGTKGVFAGPKKWKRIMRPPVDSFETSDASSDGEESVNKMVHSNFRSRSRTKTKKNSSLQKNSVLMCTPKKCVGRSCSAKCLKSSSLNCSKFHDQVLKSNSLELQKARSDRESKVESESITRNVRSSGRLQQTRGVIALSGEKIRRRSALISNELSKTVLQNEMTLQDVESLPSCSKSGKTVLKSKISDGSDCVKASASEEKFPNDDVPTPRNRKSAKNSLKSKAEDTVTFRKKTFRSKTTRSCSRVSPLRSNLKGEEWKNNLSVYRNSNLRPFGLSQRAEVQEMKHSESDNEILNSIKSSLFINEQLNKSPSENFRTKQKTFRASNQNKRSHSEDAENKQLQFEPDSKHEEKSKHVHSISMLSVPTRSRVSETRLTAGKTDDDVVRKRLIRRRSVSSDRLNRVSPKKPRLFINNHNFSDSNVPVCSAGYVRKDSIYNDRLTDLMSSKRFPTESTPQTSSTKKIKNSKSRSQGKGASRKNSESELHKPTSRRKKVSAQQKRKCVYVEEFTCRECGLQFDSSESYLSHDRDDCANIVYGMGLMADDQLYECPHCHLTFAYKSTQKKHSSSCRSSRPRKAPKQHLLDHSTQLSLPPAVHTISDKKEPPEHADVSLLEDLSATKNSDVETSKFKTSLTSDSGKLERLDGSNVSTPNTVGENQERHAAKENETIINCKKRKAISLLSVSDSDCSGDFSVERPSMKKLKRMNERSCSSKTKIEVLKQRNNGKECELEKCTLAKNEQNSPTCENQNQIIELQDSSDASTDSSPKRPLFVQTSSVRVDVDSGVLTNTSTAMKSKKNFGYVSNQAVGNASFSSSNSVCKSVIGQVKYNGRKSNIPIDSVSPQNPNSELTIALIDFGNVLEEKCFKDRSMVEVAALMLQYRLSPNQVRDSLLVACPSIGSVEKLSGSTTYGNVRTDLGVTRKTATDKEAISQSLQVWLPSQPFAEESLPVVTGSPCTWCAVLQDLVNQPHLQQLHLLLIEAARTQKEREQQTARANDHCRYLSVDCSPEDLLKSVSILEEIIKQIADIKVELSRREMLFAMKETFEATIS